MAPRLTAGSPRVGPQGLAGWGGIRDDAGMGKHDENQDKPDPNDDAQGQGPIPDEDEGGAHAEKDK